MKTNAEVKSEILRIMASVRREGTGELVDYLISDKCDYFTAPASTKFHDSEVGGLARHSLFVYNLLVKKTIMFGLNIDPETLSIVGLFHDAGKINYYKPKTHEVMSAAQLKYLTDLAKPQTKQETDDISKTSKDFASQLIEWYKNGAVGDKPKPIMWEIRKDTALIGHGELSLVNLLKYINLTDEEMVAIRWHMGTFDNSTMMYPNKQLYNDATVKYPLTTLVFTADFEASSMIEVLKANAAKDMKDIK